MKCAIVISVLCVLVTGGTAWKGLRPPDTTYQSPATFVAAEAKPGPNLTPQAALFIGDSYTVGGFGKLTAADMGWVANVDAEGGTGYLNNGHVNSMEYSPYQSRIEDDAEQFVADYVIVSGGRNDIFSPGLGDASLKYFRTVKRLFPKAKLIVILPFWQTADAPENLLRARRQIAASARAVGAPTINPAKWLDMTVIGKDGVHPNSDGQQRIADRLTTALQTLLTRRSVKRES